MPVRRAAWICETAFSCALLDALVETEKLRKQNTLWKSKVHELQEDFKWRTPAPYSGQKTGRRVASDKQNGKSK